MPYKNIVFIKGWKKGKGKYPGIWDRIKDMIISRAEHKCEICFSQPSKFRKDYKGYDDIKTKNFRVHHKDADKGNCDFSNLMYVCMHCHGRLHRGLNAL